MTVIILTGKNTTRSAQVGADIAKRLSFEFITQQQLEKLVAGRSGVEEPAVARLLSGEAPWLERCSIRRHMLLWYTTAEIATLAARDNIALQAPARAAAALRQIQHVIFVDVCTQPAPIAVVKLKHWGRHREIDQNPQPLRRSSHQVCCDLVLNPVHIAKCSDLVRALTQNTRFQSTPASRAKLVSVLRRAHARCERFSTRISRCLQVSIGADQVPLTGITSAEQAIARIEEDLRPKRHRRSLADQPSLPPPIV